MNNLIYDIPVKVHFGENQLGHLGEELSKYSRYIRKAACQLEKLLISVYNIDVKLYLCERGFCMKSYISIREASYQWGVSERRVNQYCTQGRIPGAERFGRSWAIPRAAQKPQNPRKGKDGNNPEIRR